MPTVTARRTETTRALALATPAAFACEGPRRVAVDSDDNIFAIKARRFGKPREFAPMLARKAGPGERFAAGMLAAAKLDGVRCLVVNGQPQTRSGAAFPNVHLAAALPWAQLADLDGELVLGSPAAQDAFDRTSAALMSGAAPLDGLRFHVFDDFSAPATIFADRLSTAAARIDALSDARVTLIPHIRTESADDIAAAEAEAVRQGYEGLVLRAPDRAYRYGRTTFRGVEFLKIKRFDDAEAEVVATHPIIRGGEPLAVLRSLTVRLIDGTEFDIGTGFSAARREELWATRESLIGQTVKYRFQTAGAKHAPRFASFLGLRSALDL